MSRLDGGGEPLALSATDTDDAWLITLADNCVRERARGDGPAAVAVRGSYGDLPVTHGRLSYGDTARFNMAGDGELLTAWLEATAW
ncbi:hypothetical protein ACIBQ6_00130 [Nonomuraea sp. NPDC049655]|uniref:hypothetical protein n=1 Tax=Nonomuraea sp. NPDC049655 TaxID=3364355 RepID=UPI0037B01AB7